MGISIELHCSECLNTSTASGCSHDIPASSPTSFAMSSAVNPSAFYAKGNNLRSRWMAMHANIAHEMQTRERRESMRSDLDGDLLNVSGADWQPRMARIQVMSNLADFLTKDPKHFQERVWALHDIAKAKKALGRSGTVITHNEIESARHLARGRLQHGIHATHRVPHRPTHHARHRTRQIIYPTVQELERKHLLAGTPMKFEPNLKRNGATSFFANVQQELERTHEATSFLANVHRSAADVKHPHQLPQHSHALLTSFKEKPKMPKEPPKDSDIVIEWDECLPKEEAPAIHELPATWLFGGGAVVGWAVGTMVQLVQRIQQNRQKQAEAAAAGAGGDAPAAGAAAPAPG